MISSSSYSSSMLSSVLTLLLFGIIIAATFNSQCATYAQNIIRNRGVDETVSVSMIELAPITPVEIVNLVSSSTSALANSFFPLPSSSIIFYQSFTFRPDWTLPQIPFTCGSQQVNCRTIRCLLTCDNTTYSLALRCGSPSSSAALTLIALTQDSYNSFDDQHQITLAVNQRLEGGSVCQFSFANNFFGRTTIGGRLRGSVILTTQRMFPQFSSLPFFPALTLWNNTKTSLNLVTDAATRFPSAYVRCATTGKVTFVQSPFSTSLTSSLSNWTAACCYDSTKNTGNCTTAFSNSTTPSFYFRNQTDSLSATGSSSLLVWSKATSKITSSATLSASCPEGEPLTVNISVFVNSSIDNHYLLKNSLFSILEMMPNNHPNTDTSAVGLFKCFDDTVDSSSNDNNTSNSNNDTTGVEYVCVAYASNRSFWIAKPNSQFSGEVQDSSAIFIPLCQKYSSSSFGFQSPLGPIDDASTSSMTPIKTAAELSLQKVITPLGSCRKFTNIVECGSAASHCIWSNTLNACLWGDSIFLTSSNQQARSVDCQWSLTSGIQTGVDSDFSCTISNSSRTLSSLLAALCLQRGFNSNQINWCIRSAFLSSCSTSTSTLTSNLEKLMAFYCLPSAYTGSIPTCTDSALLCSPNTTSLNLNPFLTTALSGGGTQAPSVFVLNVLPNRSSISVTNEIRSTPSSSNNRFYIPVGIFLIATGAYFNLTAIRTDLRTRTGFNVRVPVESTNNGRFSLAEKFLDLFPDPDFAVTDIYGNGVNVSIADSLVIRVTKTESFKPLPGTNQFLDIRPDQHSFNNSWMSPRDIFSFQPVTIAFYEEPVESCSYLGISVAITVFGLLSGMSGWMIIGAAQVTLIAAQSTCAPDIVRQCTEPTRAIVNIAHAFWTSSSDENNDGNIDVVENYDRKVFWSQFLILMIVLILHTVLVRVYKYVAPLKGSPERTLWYPAPTYLLSGLFAVGTVQKAWIVIFNDEVTALRVLSFFCFAAIIGTIIPWWFLETFREKENYFKSYDFTKMFKQLARNTTSEEEANERERRLLREHEEKELQSSRRRREQQQQQQQKDASSSPQRKSKKKHKDKKNNKDSTSATKSSTSLMTSAETSNLSLRHTEHMDRRRAKSRHIWASKTEEYCFLAFSFFTPTGWWPHTRGMSPARDLLHPKGSFFSWVSLVILGFSGLNFSYIGAEIDLCTANYVNHAILQAIWIVFTVYWRPFRIPVLNLLWIIARVLDFANAIVSADWIALRLPSENDKVPTISNLVVASLVFTLIFSIATFILKLKEAINSLVNGTENLVEAQQEERALDAALNEITIANHPDENDDGDNSKNRGRSSTPNSATDHQQQQQDKKKVNFFDRFDSAIDSQFTLTSLSAVVPLSASPHRHNNKQNDMYNNIDENEEAGTGGEQSFYSPTVSNRSRRAVDIEKNPFTYRRDTQYDFNYYHGQDDFDTSPRIEAAEEELLFGNNNQKQKKGKNSASSSSTFHRLEIWWDHDGKINQNTNSDFDDDDDFDDDQRQQEKDSYYDAVMVQNRSQRTANLLAAFPSLVKIHEIPPNRSLPASKNEGDRSSSSSDETSSSGSSSSSNNNDDHYNDDEELRREKEQRRHQRLERRQERQIRSQMKQQHKRVEQKKNRLRRKGYRLMVTFGETSDALTAARSLAGKIDDASGTRIFCELLPDHFDLSVKKQDKPKYYASSSARGRSDANNKIPQQSQKMMPSNKNNNASFLQRRKTNRPQPPNSSRRQPQQQQQDEYDYL